MLFDGSFEAFGLLARFLEALEKAPTEYAMLQLHHEHARKIAKRLLNGQFTYTPRPGEETDG